MVWRESLGAKEERQPNRPIPPLAAQAVKAKSVSLTLIMLSGLIATPPLTADYFNSQFYYATRKTALFMKEKHSYVLGRNEKGRLAL